jgi:CRISPR-associated protein (TIGR03984 family)
LLVWRDGEGNLQARLIRDKQSNEQSDWDDSLDEPYLIWGTHGIELPNEFTLLRDGSQGLRHAVPCKLVLGEDGTTTPPRLVVRHYLAKEDFARIVVSRLIGLCEEKKDA